MTPNLTKLIADNKWRDIAWATEADGMILCLSDDGELKRGRVEYQVLVPSDYYDVEPTRCVIAVDEEYRPSAEATHFRALPDDRLAMVCEVLVEAMARISKARASTSPDAHFLGGVAKEALAKAEQIAKGE